MKPFRPDPEKDKKTNAYLRYTGLGIQMLGIIALGTWGGWKLDQRAGNDSHVWVIVLSLLSVILALGLAVKDFIRPPRKKL